MSEVDELGLGRLQQMSNAREVWSHEASVFTPWLARNIDLLGEAVNLQLTVVATEVPVGEFRLDIQAEDEHGRPVVIENQIEPSDHSHLGQLLVYASGLGASTVIWIATQIRQDHRSAMEWLNSNTPPGVGFFGVEVEVVRIGSSPPAPVLNVVVQPNDWAKTVKQAGAVATSVLNEARATFFERVFVGIAAEYPVIRSPKVQPTNWCSFASGPFGNYCLTFSKAGYRIEVYLDLGDQEKTKQLFDHLYGSRQEIEQQLGFEVAWERLDDKRASRLAVYHEDFDPRDDTTAQEVAMWTVDRIIHLHRTLDTRLRTLTKQAKYGTLVGVPNPDV